MDKDEIQRILEAALMAYGKPLTVEKLQTLFMTDSLGLEDQELPEKEVITAALEVIQESCAGRGYELKKVSSGWRFQVCESMSPWVNRLWEEKPQRYSRALLETLAIIAYRQPITRSDIEEVRGVAVSSSIIKTLAEREWVKVVGQRDVPGRPSLYATTRQFLDYFNMQSLDQLPSLQELADIDSLNPELDLKGDMAVSNNDEGLEEALEGGNNDTEMEADISEVGANLETDADVALESDVQQEVDQEYSQEGSQEENQEENQEEDSQGSANDSSIVGSTHTS